MISILLIIIHLLFHFFIFTNAFRNYQLIRNQFSCRLKRLQWNFSRCCSNCKAININNQNDSNNRDRDSSYSDSNNNNNDDDDETNTELLQRLQEELNNPSSYQIIMQPPMHLFQKKEKMAIYFLEQELKLSEEVLTRIVLKYSWLMYLEVDTNLRPTIEIFRSYGFRDRDIKSIITNVPSILALNYQYTLPKKLIELQQLFHLNRINIIHLIVLQPRLLTSSSERNARVTQFFYKEINFTKNELKKILLKDSRIIMNSLTLLKKCWILLIDFYAIKKNDAKKMILKHPQLLSVRLIKNLRQRLVFFCEELDLPPPPFEPVSRLALKNPQLLYMDVNYFLYSNLNLLIKSFGFGIKIKEWEKIKKKQYLKYDEFVEKSQRLQIIRLEPQLLIYNPKTLERMLEEIWFFLTSSITSYHFIIKTTLVAKNKYYNIHNNKKNIIKKKKNKKMMIKSIIQQKQQQQQDAMKWKKDDALDEIQEEEEEEDVSFPVGRVFYQHAYERGAMRFSPFSTLHSNYQQHYNNYKEDDDENNVEEEEDVDVDDDISTSTSTSIITNTPNIIDMWYEEIQQQLKNKDNNNYIPFDCISDFITNQSIDKDDFIEYSSSYYIALATATLQMNLSNAMKTLHSAPWILIYRINRTQRLVATLAVSTGMTPLEVTKCFLLYPRLVSLSVNKKFTNVIRLLAKAAEAYIERDPHQDIKQYLPSKRDLKNSYSQWIDAIKKQFPQNNLLIESLQISDIEESLSKHRADEVRSLVRYLLLTFPHALGTSMEKLNDRIDIAEVFGLNWKGYSTTIRRNSKQHENWILRQERKAFDYVQELQQQQQEEVNSISKRQLINKGVHNFNGKPISRTEAIALLRLAGGDDFISPGTATRMAQTRHRKHEDIGINDDEPGFRNMARDNRRRQILRQKKEAELNYLIKNETKRLLELEKYDQDMKLKRIQRKYNRKSSDENNNEYLLQQDQDQKQLLPMRNAYLSMRGYSFNYPSSVLHIPNIVFSKEASSFLSIQMMNKSTHLQSRNKTLTVTSSAVSTLPVGQVLGGLLQWQDFYHTLMKQNDTEETGGIGNDRSDTVQLNDTTIEKNLDKDELNRDFNKNPFQLNDQSTSNYVNGVEGISFSDLIGIDAEGTLSKLLPTAYLGSSNNACVSIAQRTTDAAVDQSENANDTQTSSKKQIQFYSTNAIFLDNKNDENDNYKKDSS